MVWIGLIWLRIGTNGGPCEHGNKLSGSIKCGKFLSSCTNGGCEKGLSSMELVIILSSTAFIFSNVLAVAILNCWYGGN
jgi:hypothetical protein